MLVKASGTWKMQTPIDYPASSKDLQEALDKLPKLSLSDELSADVSRLDMFGLSRTSETVVRLFAGAHAAPSLEFSIGKEGPDWDSFFLRLPGGGAVLAQGLPARDIKKSAGDWLAKSVANYPPDSITLLRVVSKGRRVELNKKGQDWVSAGRSISSATVASVVVPAIVAVAGLEADHVIPVKSSPVAKVLGLNNPEMTIEFAGPVAVTLTLGAKDAQGGRYVKRTGEDRVYFSVPDWKFDTLRKKEFASIGRLKPAASAAKQETSNVRQEAKK